MPESYSTPWYFQLEEPDLIDPAVSMTARLELYTDAHGTLISDNYDECSPKNHERTHRGEVRCHWLQQETTDVTASMRSDHEKQTKWELSALVSSRSLGERTDVESQINGIYLTWCRHHNTVLGSKRCIRRTQCHQDSLWRYVFLSACSCTGSKTISTRANIQMVYRGDASCTSNLHARTSLPSAFSC